MEGGRWGAGGGGHMQQQQDRSMGRLSEKSSGIRNEAALCPVISADVSLAGTPCPPPTPHLLAGGHNTAVGCRHILECLINCFGEHYNTCDLLSEANESHNSP